MNKRIFVLTGLLGTTMALTGCVSGSPEDKAIKAFDDTAKIVFEIRNEKELDKVVSDMKGKYDLIDFEDEIKDKEYAEMYSELFCGDEFVKEYIDLLKDTEISFKAQDVRYVKLDKSDFEVISNPKFYVGGGEYLKLEDMFLVYNNKPIVVQNYDKAEKKVGEEIEFIMPMVVDTKGNIKAFTIIEEDEREFSEEFFLDRKGVGAMLKDLDDLQNSLDDLINIFDELESSEEDVSINIPTKPSKEDIVTEEKEEVSNSQVQVSKDSYVKLSNLNMDVSEDKYATYEDEKTGLDIFVSFLDDGREAIDISIPTSNINDVEFNKQLEIAMKRVGRSSKDVTALKSKMKECLTEKFQSQADIKAEMEKWDGMFSVKVIETDNLEVEITVYDAGTHRETISVEYFMY